MNQLEITEEIHLLLGMLSMNWVDKQFSQKFLPLVLQDSFPEVSGAAGY